MPTNFLHSSRIYSTKPTQQIFHNFNALKFIQQHHILPTLPKFITYQHCSSYTMPKNTTIQNIPLKPRLQHDRPYNVPNFNNSTQQQNDNVSTSNFQWNIKTTIFPNKEKKEKLTLKSILECGAWVLVS